MIQEPCVRFLTIVVNQHRFARYARRLCHRPSLSSETRDGPRGGVQFSLLSSGYGRSAYGCDRGSSAVDGDCCCLGRFARTRIICRHYRRLSSIGSGLPSPRLPAFSSSLVFEVLPSALSFTLLGAVESLLPPKWPTTLAGMLVVVCWNMAEKEEFLRLLHDRRSASVLIVTFGLTLIEDLTFGIVAGCLLAALFSIFDRVKRRLRAHS